MFSFLFFTSLFIGLCITKPQPPITTTPTAEIASRTNENSPIPILSQNEENNPDGSFQFSYETGNGIKVEEKGYLKQGINSSEQIQVIEGSVSYTDNEGNPINLKYIADENGYQPQGDHIPKSLGPQLGNTSPENFGDQSFRTFGTQSNATGSFGGQQNIGSFGSQPNSPGNFEEPQTTRGFGAQTDTFGNQPTTGGFGAQTTLSENFGEQQTTRGFGAQSGPSKGFGNQQTNRGFGAQSISSGGFGSQQTTRRFGAQTSTSVGFGNQQTTSGFGTQSSTVQPTANFGAQPGANSIY